MHPVLAVKVEWRATSKLATQPFLAIIKLSVLTIFFVAAGRNITANFQLAANT